jgi:hypothetical protein
MSGKGGIACVHPVNIGLFARYSRVANNLIEVSDCLIVVCWILVAGGWVRRALDRPALRHEEFGGRTYALSRFDGENIPARHPTLCRFPLPSSFF